MIYLSMKYFACSPTSAFGIQTGYEFHKCFVGCARGWHSFKDVPLTYWWPNSEDLIKCWYVFFRRSKDKIDKLVYKRADGRLYFKNAAWEN